MLSLRFCLALGSALVGFATNGHAHENHVESHSYEIPSEAVVIGEGAFKYRLIPGWAQHNSRQITLGEGKAIVEDSQGRIYHLNGSADHCVVVLSPTGKLINAWGNFAPSAHGLNIVTEGDREVLFISENCANGRIYKTSLDGKRLMTVSCPTESGLYPDPSMFRPAEIVPLPNGDFFVLDGYGSDYILRFNQEGTFLSAFGGDLGEGDARLSHWGPHGANIDWADPERPVLIVGLSDQEKIKRFRLDGSHLQTIHLPGSNPRDIYFHRDHLFVPHLGDDWPKTRNNPGYISVMDYDFNIVANLGASSAVYKDGHLVRMTHNQHAFHHPHGILLASDGSLYVVQDASNKVWPMKFRPLD